MGEKDDLRARAIAEGEAVYRVPGPSKPYVRAVKVGRKWIATLNTSHGTQVAASGASELGALRALWADLEESKRRRESNPRKRVKWHPLTVAGGELNGAVKRATEDASGVYAIREASSHRVVYVGESSRGRMWRTILRHFQAPESFRKVRETGVFARSPVGYEVAYEVTSRGARPREGTKRAKLKGGARAADQRVMDLQREWIARMDPVRNKDDGAALEGPINAPEDDDPWGGLLNPPRALQALGKLTRLETRGGQVMTWPLRDAPILAYDKEAAGESLYIVYVGQVLRPSSSEEKKEYRRTHWGLEGEGKVRDGRVAVPPFVVLGRGAVITYTTRKGTDSKLTDYVHAWGEGQRRGAWAPPFYVEHRCPGGCAAKCASRGAMALVGGTYRVDSRGIVG